MEKLDNITDYMDIIKEAISFRFLSEDEIKEILTGSSLINFQLDEKIVKEGDVNQFLYVIIKGCVQVSVSDTEDKKEVYISTIGEKETFGEAGIFLKVKRTANVSALNETLVLRIPRTVIMAFINNHPRSGNKLLMVIVYSLLKKLRSNNQELAYERQNDSEQDEIDKLVMDLTN